MKKIILYSFTALLAFSFIPNDAKAAVEPKTELPTDPAATMQSLENRLVEIKGMDMSSLSHQDKSNLRKEVRSIHKTMKSDNGGVYISAGALLLIIIVLLIIFL